MNANNEDLPNSAPAVTPVEGPKKSARRPKAASESTQGRVRASSEVEAKPKAAKQKSDAVASEASKGSRKAGKPEATVPDTALAQGGDTAKAGGPSAKQGSRPASKTKPEASAAMQSALPASTQRDDIPPVTPEAISFLRDPDPKVKDFFKLQPESRAFVHYHVMRTQLIDALHDRRPDSILNTALRESIAFSKSSDSQMANLGKQVAAGVAQQRGDQPEQQAQLVSASRQRAPLGWSAPQVAIPVALRSMDIASEVKASKKTAGSQQEQMTGQATNTIERGPVLERKASNLKTGMRELEEAPPVEAIATGISATATRPSKRMLQTVGKSVQAAGAWLHNKGAEGAPARTAPAVETKPPAYAKVTPDDQSPPVPDSVSKRFLRVKQDYFFPDKTFAFSDSGDKLATRGANPEVVRSLVDIARARGWDSIVVKGTDEFRRGAWMEAVAAGVRVQGYKPTALDLAEMELRPATNTLEQETIKERARPQAKGVAQAVGGESDKATPTSGNDGPKAAVQGASAKAEAFETGKPGVVVKKHPDLAPAYGIVDAAKKFADASLPSEVRSEFVGLARRHVLQQITSGEAVKGPQVYMQAAKLEREAVLPSSVVAEKIDGGKSARAKEVVRER